MARHNYTPLPGGTGQSNGNGRNSWFSRRSHRPPPPPPPLLLLSLYLLHTSTTPLQHHHDYHWRTTYTNDPSPESLQVDLNRWEEWRGSWNPFRVFRVADAPPSYPPPSLDSHTPNPSEPHRSIPDRPGHVHTHDPSHSQTRLPTPQTPITGINRGQPRGQGKREIKLFPWKTLEEANRQAERRLEECLGERVQDRRRRRRRGTPGEGEEVGSSLGGEGLGGEVGVDSEEVVFCGNNELKIAVLQSFWFVEGLKGSNTGEAVWAESIINSLHSLNYTLIFTSLGWLNSDMSLTISTYRKYSDLIKVVIADHPAVNACWADEDDAEAGCLDMDGGEVLFLNGEKGEGGIRGGEGTGVIPAWKLLTLSYWDHVANPLGPEWTLSPHMTNSNRFISYSIEPSCLRHSFVPIPLRPENRTYIFGKNTIYLVPSHNDTAWTVDELSTISEELKLDAFVAMNENEGEASAEIKASEFITNLGKLGPAEFRNELATSRVFVGVGRPRISPSPFDALCLGVPFINPIGTYARGDVWDRERWLGQHWAMQEFEPPYVYNVFAHDTEGLKGAIEMALANPIDSFIPEYMTFDFACDAIAAVMEDDWRGKYHGLYQQAYKDRMNQK